MVKRDHHDSAGLMTVAVVIVLAMIAVICSVAFVIMAVMPWIEGVLR